MKIIKDMIKSSIISIMMSCMIFVLVGMIFDLRNKGVFELNNYGFTKMAAACIITGLGFGIPSVIYRSEKLPMAVKTIIHMGIGMSIYFISALNVGWIPIQAGLWACVITIIGVVIITMIIWYCFMKYQKKLAERMNERIRERQRI